MSRLNPGRPARSVKTPLVGVFAASCLTLLTLAPACLTLLSPAPARNVAAQIHRTTSAVGDEDQRATRPRPYDWPAHVLDSAEPRLSRLDQINSSSPEKIARGQRLYDLNCRRCHPLQNATHPALRPATRLSLNETPLDLFPQMVDDGEDAAPQSMPTFKDVLSNDDVESICAYIMMESKKLAESAR